MFADTAVAIVVAVARVAVTIAMAVTAADLLRIIENFSLYCDLHSIGFIRTTAIIIQYDSFDHTSGVLTLNSAWFWLMTFTGTRVRHKFNTYRWSLVMSML